MFEELMEKGSTLLIYANQRYKYDGVTIIDVQHFNETTLIHIKNTPEAEYKYGKCEKIINAKDIETIKILD